VDPDGKDSRRAAFLGATWTVHGCCVNHRDIQVCNPVKINGRTKYQSMKLCPKCEGGIDARRNRSNDERSVYRKHIKSDRKQVHPIALNELVRPSQIQYDAPFDLKGRCHHHKNVKLAIRQFGEWKVLVETCPACREEAIYRSQSSKPRKSNERKYVNRYDSDGFCINHPNVKVAKKKVTGSWKVSSQTPFLAFYSMYVLNMHPYK
jgi:predicted RNA-binding Zn-ribbon protein involved in translation (DUF1610 family)